ncbi:MAG: 3-hydroxyacyl-CoA dehydrogenase NAD-binding domain-containing protein [Abditibacteriaceae bacterium]
MNPIHTKILIVGSGTMGSGIAQVAAVAGSEVILFDAFDGAAQKAKDRITHFLERETEKEHITPEAATAALARLTIASSLDEAANADIVIEAIRERLEDKQELFKKLDAITKPETLLLSNTSMISITQIAKSTFHPERVAGCHFFNPVPRMALVEIISGAETSKSTFDAVSALVASWGKMPITAPDTPGFIVNRALLMLLNEAAFLVEEGNAPADVDEAMKLGCNFPMGPLALSDLIGVDVVLDCQTALWEQYERRDKYEPCALLRRMVDEGKLGRKSSEGFYSY